MIQKTLNNHFIHMNLVASTNPNYSAIVNQSQIEFYYEGKSAAIISFHGQYDVSKVLDIWSRLGTSPQDARRIYEACKSLVGLDWAQATLSPDGRSVLYRSKVIGNIF